MNQDMNQDINLRYNFRLSTRRKRKRTTDDNYDENGLPLYLPMLIRSPALYRNECKVCSSFNLNSVGNKCTI